MLSNLLQKTGKFEIETYKSKPKNLKDNHVPFSGSPLKHPADDEKIILITDPYDMNINYYEFYISDVIYVEELPNITNYDGETITMVRLWVKKKAMGIRCTPFIVENIRTHTR